MTAGTSEPAVCGIGACPRPAGGDSPFCLECQAAIRGTLQQVDAAFPEGGKP